jgi:hypothetical protein
MNQTYFPLLLPIEIHNRRLNQASKYAIAGHPGYTSVDYQFPGSSKKPGIKQKLREVFCGFSKLVVSKGCANPLLDEILEVKCSTTSGMSGSPCFEITDENQNPGYLGYSFAGIYTGGPPLPYQFEIFQIVKSFMQLANKKEVIRRLEEVKNEIKCLPIAQKIENIQDRVRILRHPFIRAEIHELITLTSLAMKEIVLQSQEIQNRNDAFLFNTVIPVTHPVFRYVEKVIQHFRVRSISNQVYSTFKEFADDMKSSI